MDGTPMSNDNNEYTAFAEVYDAFMDDIPYDAWCDYICELLDSYGITSGTIAELGCGTGTLTRKFRDRGFDMIGIDISESMLTLAQEQSTERITYSKQDMRQLKLDTPVSAILCLCDSINYLLEEEDLLDTFKRVKENLVPGGVFIFDMKTYYMYKELMGINAFVDNREDKYLGWENYFDEEECINDYNITIFKKEKDGSYTRYEEFHQQRCYFPDEVIELLEESGLCFEHLYDECVMEEPAEECERYYFICTKK